jgi:hypothetical protein
MVGMSIWGPGPFEYRFLWQWNVTAFVSEVAARTTVRLHSEDPRVNSRLKRLLVSRAMHALEGDALVDWVARLLHTGQLISVNTETNPFNPLWRCQARFWDRAFALQFLARFQRRPLAMAHLRALLRERYRAHAQLSDDALLAEIAALLRTGELTVGYISHLSGGTSGSDSEQTQPVRRAAPEAAPARAAPASKEEQEEAPTFANHDGVAQADALRAAAANGVPFCEECAAAALARSK